MRIIVLEDDPDQSMLLKLWLEKDGHVCHVYDNGKSFVRAFAQESFDIALLDWMVPNSSGLEVLRHVRGHLESNVPVIFVTQRDREEDIVKALEAGADDYISKPLREAETVARVQAVARRGVGRNANSTQVLDLPPYKIDTAKRTVSLDDEVVEMTQKEYELTLFLFKNLGRVISRGHMLEMVWATSSDLNTRTVDTHISRLRTKLKIDEQKQWKLLSVYRHGYRLEQIEDN